MAPTELASDASLVTPADLPKVSADSHVEEPRFFWYDNLPASMKDRAPKTIRPSEEGGWELVGHDEETPEQQRLRERSEEMSRLAALQPAARLEIMREDGISGECIFPTIGLYVWDVPDPDVGEACCQIYNDWIHDEIESQSNRFRCAGLIPTWSVEAAITEVRRIERLGLGAAMLPLVAAPDWNHKQWEPLWEALEESALPAVMHQGTGHDMVWYRGPGAAVANLLATQTMAPRAVGLLASSGVLERHPGLHFVFVEVNASWLAWAMDTLDFYYHSFQQYGWTHPLLRETPSYYVSQQVHATFQDDPSATANLARTGISPLMWGSDYPHEEGTYPHSRETVNRLFSHLSEADARAVLGETAVRVFRFDPGVLESTP